MADSFFGFDTALPVSSADGCFAAHFGLLEFHRAMREKHEICCTYLKLKITNLIYTFTLQHDEDSGGLDRELPEDRYDALNDETFSNAVKDDWEGE